MLTNQKHIAFLDEYFSNGLNATKAYLEIYPNSSLAAAQSSASDLIKNLRIEIERRQAIIAAKEEIKREEIVAHLQNMITTCIKDNDKSNLIKALNLLNKMAGFYATDKIDVTTGGEKISINLNLNDTENNIQA